MGRNMLSTHPIILAQHFFAPLVSFGLPFVYVITARKNNKRVFSGLDAIVSATAGMALAHLMLHILPLSTAHVVIAVRIDGAFAVLGFFCWHSLHRLLMKLEARSTPLITHPIPWGRYGSRYISRVAFLELWYVGTVQAAMEGFHMTVARDNSLRSSAVVYQMLLGTILGVSALKASYSFSKLTLAALLFAVGMPAGMIWGKVANTVDGGRGFINLAWALAQHALSGGHVSVIFNHLVLPEVMAKTGTNIYRIGGGVLLWLTITIPFLGVH